LQCKVTATFKGEDEPQEYTSPKVRDIKVKNSPLWVSDPQQQLGYYSVRAWVRRHCPDVLLGVYAPDEIDPSYNMRTVNGGGDFKRVANPMDDAPAEIDQPGPELTHEDQQAIERAEDKVEEEARQKQDRLDYIASVIKSMSDAKSAHEMKSIHDVAVRKLAARNDGTAVTRITREYGEQKTRFDTVKENV